MNNLRLSLKRYFLVLLWVSGLLAACTHRDEKTQDTTANDGVQDTTPKVQVETLLKTTESWNSTPLPDYYPEHPEMTALRITIPPHTKLPVHRHPVINAGILLSGALTVISEAGDTLQMKTGDVIAEMVNQWHHGENNGDVPAEIVVFYSGNVGTPVTILKEAQGPEHSQDANHSGH
jgi:quercetin dioxygenase-like cupin family protein